MNMTAATVSLGATFQANTPRKLFAPGFYNLAASFDVTADGERFVLPVALDYSKAGSPSVFLNWIQTVGHQVLESP